MKHPPQEADLVPGGKILTVGIGVIVATIVGVLVAYGIGACASAEPGSGWMSGNPPQPPREVNAMETAVFSVEAQGIELNQRAEEFLRRYSWVDRDKGTVRVPIEVAFDLFLTRQRKGAEK